MSQSILRLLCQPYHRYVIYFMNNFFLIATTITIISFSQNLTNRVEKNSKTIPTQNKVMRAATIILGQFVYNFIIIILLFVIDYSLTGQPPT